MVTEWWPQGLQDYSYLEIQEIFKITTLTQSETEKKEGEGGTRQKRYLILI